MHRVHLDIEAVSLDVNALDRFGSHAPEPRCGHWSGGMVGSDEDTQSARSRFSWHGHDIAFGFESCLPQASSRRSQLPKSYGSRPWVQSEHTLLLSVDCVRVLPVHVPPEEPQHVESAFVELAQPLTRKLERLLAPEEVVGL